MTAFATQNRHGVYAPQETLALPMPRPNWKGGPLAAIDLAFTPEGWRAAIEYQLEERGHCCPITDRVSPPFPTRDAAIGYGIKQLRSGLKDHSGKLVRMVLAWLDTLQPAQMPLL